MIRNRQLYDNEFSQLVIDMQAPVTTTLIGIWNCFKIFKSEFYESDNTNEERM